MRLLPKSEWTFDQEASDSVIVGAHEHEGCLWHTKFLLSDLPNDLVSLDDLERIGISLVERSPIAEPKPRCVGAD